MKAKQLRNAVLQLALQGKLVSQDPSDEPASVLLEKIKVEKEQLIKEKKIKRENPLPQITDEEIPFYIPDSWQWIKLGEIIQLINGDRGKNYPSKDKLSTEGIPFISAINIQDGEISSNNLLCVTLEQFDKLGSGKLNKNDIVFCIRGSLGKNGIYQFENGAIASSLVILRQYSFRSKLLMYLYYYINAPILFTEIKKYVNGTAQPNLSAQNLKNFLVPLPPLAEQERIIEKIEEIMPLIEKYEKLESELSKLETDFPKNLKKSILQYAVQGKIVEQNKDDEPASVLLEKIKLEKEELINEKKIKKEKPLPEITDEEKPFDIPSSWEWVRLGEIIKISSGNGLTSKEMCIDGTIPVYGGNGITGYHDKYNVNSPTLVIGRVGFYCGSVHITENPAWVTDNAFITRFQEDKLNINYLKILFITLDLRKHSSSTAQPVISGKTVYPAVIALPPLAEQQRIVSRVEELMVLCGLLGDENVISTHKPVPKESKIIELKTKLSHQGKEVAVEFDMVARAEIISPKTQEKIAERIRLLRAKK